MVLVEGGPLFLNNTQSDRVHWPKIKPGGWEDNTIDFKTIEQNIFWCKKNHYMKLISVHSDHYRFTCSLTLIEHLVMWGEEQIKKELEKTHKMTCSLKLSFSIFSISRGTCMVNVRTFSYYSRASASFTSGDSCPTFLFVCHIQKLFLANLNSAQHKSNHLLRWGGMSAPVPQDGKTQ